jgi:CubicO group peptidase (beta-lactamase class C family)
MNKQSLQDTLLSLSLLLAINLAPWTLISASSVAANHQSYFGEPTVVSDSVDHVQAQEDLETSFKNIAARYDMMGGILALGCQESEPQFFPVGWSDDYSQTPITADTPFRIASISKMITALGVMKLVQEGVLDLDAPIDNYLGFPVTHPLHPDSPITTRMMLSHQSSIMDGTAYNRFLSFSYSSAETPSLESLLNAEGEFYSEELFHPEKPGNWFQYSNLNYGILGTLIEAVSSKAFDVFIKEEILIPLGVQAGFSSYTQSYDVWPATLYRKPDGVWTTQADRRPTEGSARDGKKYPENRDSIIIGKNAIPYGPQGSLRISSADLMRILWALQQGLSDHKTNEQWLNSTTINQMTETQWSSDTGNGDDYHGLFRAWGLGIHLLTGTEGKDVLFARSKTMLGHSGLAYGLVSSAYLDPEQGVRIAFITNGIGMPFAEDNRSSFYSVEKDVFEAAESYLAKLGCLQ